MKECSLCGYIKPIHFLKRYGICDDCYLYKWNNGEPRIDSGESDFSYADKMLVAFSHGYLYLDDYEKDKRDYKESLK